MRSKTIIANIAVLIFFGLLGAGCATSTIGNQNLNSDNIAKIQKGVTTKAEVIELLGQPDTVGMMGDGRRMMIYSGMQGNVDNSQMMLAAIPIAGGLIPEHTSQSMHRQTLQVILTSADIVQDYEYSDNTSQTDTSVSALGAHVDQKTTPSGAGN
jgi:outer membrane protein assembly factor BamE (lipoprotein component of BamABCDE complex)